MTESEEPAWYRRPVVLGALALFVLLAGVGAGLFLAGDDEGTQVDTTDTTAASTAPPPATAPPVTTNEATTTVDAASLCADGDQGACDRLDDDQLETFCEEGNVDACQVLLARQGDGVPDGAGGENGGGGDD